MEMILHDITLTFSSKRGTTVLGWHSKASKPHLKEPGILDGKLLPFVKVLGLRLVTLSYRGVK